MFSYKLTNHCYLSPTVALSLNGQCLVNSIVQSQFLYQNLLKQACTCMVTFAEKSGQLMPVNGGSSWSSKATCIMYALDEIMRSWPTQISCITLKPSAISQLLSLPWQQLQNSVVQDSRSPALLYSAQFSLKWWMLLPLEQSMGRSPECFWWSYSNTSWLSQSHKSEEVRL